MQVSGYGSLAEYYAELARQKALTSDSAQSTAGSLLGAMSGTSETESGDFASIFAQSTESVPPPPPPPQGGGGGESDAEELLNMLENTDMLGGVTENDESATGNFFTEMLKSFGSGGESGGGSVAYIQNMIKSAYGA